MVNNLVMLKGWCKVVSDLFHFHSYAPQAVSCHFLFPVSRWQPATGRIVIFMWDQQLESLTYVSYSTFELFTSSEQSVEVLAIFILSDIFTFCILMSKLSKYI